MDPWTVDPVLPQPDVGWDLERLVEDTYYSCPPPPPKTVRAIDRDGNDVEFELPPPVSTVDIDYVFQIQLLEEEDDGDGSVEYLLSKLKSRLGESLAANFKSHTANGQDSSSCGGYYVGDFQRRLVNDMVRTASKDRQMVEEDVPTRIIGISSDKDLSIDEDERCVPPNEGCFVLRGEYAVTYIGYNEAGVKSSITRAVKGEMDEGGGDSKEDLYQLSFLGLKDELTRSAEPEISAINVMDYMVESESDGTGLTLYGIGFIVALGSTFMGLFYVLFKSDTAKNAKQNMEERKSRVAEEEDEEGDSHCQGLESVYVERDANGKGEAQVEVQIM